MAVTLAQLLAPVTADTVKAVLLSALEGIGPVQQVGSGAGTLVVSGGPLGNYDVVVIIQGGGAPGTATFTYSLDGGTTISGPFTVPSNGVYTVTGTGMVFNFAGNFNVGDEYLLQTVFPPFPVTDWASGSAGRTFVEAEASAIADFAGNALPAIAGGGFVDYASGANAPNDWLSLLSHELYENDRFSAQATVGLVNVTLAATASSQTISAGQLIIANAVGTGTSVLTYRNVSGFTINPGQTLAIAFQAVQPGAKFNVSNGALTILQTAIAGLSVSNPSPGISSVTHSGSGSGTVVVSGSPNGNYSVVVRVATSGALGTAQVQISLDGGSNYASPLTITAANYNVVQLDGVTSTGLVLTFANTFVSGDTYSFTAYQQWVTTPGLDTESNQALQARDSNKWAALALGGGTSRTFDYLARSTPSGGSEVTKTQSAADAVVAGQIDLAVAGYNGPVSSSALSAITSYVTQRIGITNTIVVRNATTQSVPVTAVVFVPAAQLSGVQAAITSAFATLQAVVPIGGTVYWSDIEAALNQKQAGVRDVHLTVPAPNTDTVLPAFTVASFDLTNVSYVLV